MKPFTLPFLWFLCATLLAAMLLVYFHACQPSADLWLPPLSVVPARPADRPRVSRSHVEPVQPPAEQSPQSYTFVAPSQPPETTDSIEARSSKKSSQALPEKNEPVSRRAAAKTDSGLAINRVEPVSPTSGAIPDLTIDLNGVDLDRVIRRYGYVPAVKTRERILGKIVGTKFIALTSQEMSLYARRGRSAAGLPQAGPWCQRIAHELRLPPEDLHFIFLVPHETENLFIGAERAAVARAAKPLEDIAIVRAHFDSSLAVVVDAVITKTGETIAIDSLRVAP